MKNKTCIICLINDANQALNNIKKNHRLFWSARIKLLNERLLTAKDIRSLHCCSASHYNEARSLRSTATAYNSGRFISCFNNAKNAIVLLSKEELKLERLLRKGMGCSKDADVSRAMINHYTILVAQRMRRLREVLMQNKENTTFTRQVLELEASRRDRKF